MEYKDDMGDGDGARGEVVMVEHVCGEQLVPRDATSTLLNGGLNGVSGTGHILGVLPALAMPTWAVAGAYLGCFGIGTFVTMTIFTGLVGEVSSQMTTTLNSPAAPANLAMAASALALAMGVLWTGRALAVLKAPAEFMQTAAVGMRALRP